MRLVRLSTGDKKFTVSAKFSFFVKIRVVVVIYGAGII